MISHDILYILKIVGFALGSQILAEAWVLLIFLKAAKVKKIKFLYIVFFLPAMLFTMMVWADKKDTPEVKAKYYEEQKRKSWMPELYNKDFTKYRQAYNYKNNITDTSSEFVIYDIF